MLVYALGWRETPQVCRGVSERLPGFCSFAEEGPRRTGGWGN